jgi:hypothetical protein
MKKQGPAARVVICRNDIEYRQAQAGAQTVRLRLDSDGTAHIFAGCQ